MAASMGFARAFSRVGFFERDDLAAVGSNSGGSWFLTRFAYEADFFHAVTQGSMAAFYNFTLKMFEGYNEFVDLQPPPPPTDILTRFITAFIDILDGVGLKNSDLEIYSRAALGIAEHGYSWKNFSTNLYPQSVATLPATMQTRGGLKGPQLNFQISSLPAAYVETQGAFGKTKLDIQWLLRSPSEEVANQDGTYAGALPLQWVVPGESTSASANGAGWFQPGDSEGNFHADFVGLRRSLVPDPDPNFKSVEPTALPMDLNVTMVGAMSSAAVGLMGSPLMLLQALKHYGVLEAVMESRLPFLDCAFKDVLYGRVNVGVSRLAICSGGEGPFDRCPHPETKYADGVYVDNLAAAQTVANLQSKFGRKAPIRLVLTDNNGPEDGPRADIAALFDGLNGVEPGAFTPSMFGILAPSPQIFEANYTDLDWTNVSASGGRTFQVANISTTTILNPTFDVLDGTPIEVLIFAIDTDLPMLGTSVPGQWGAPSHAQQFARLAKSTADEPITQKLKEWLSYTA